MQHREGDGRRKGKRENNKLAIRGSCTCLEAIINIISKHCILLGFVS